MNQEFMELLEQLPQEVAEAVLAAHQRALEEKELAAKGWEEKYQQAQFDAILRQVIQTARGRNDKAITALLDVDAIRGAVDVSAAAKEAVAQLKKEHGYLFEMPGVPGYAAGTGAMDPGGSDEPQSLAAALREKFGM